MVIVGGAFLVGGCHGVKKQASKQASKQANQTNTQIRQTSELTNTQSNKQTNKQTNEQTNKQTNKKNYCCCDKNSPQWLESTGEVGNNILEQAQGLEFREHREPRCGGDEVVREIDPLQVRTSQAMQRGYGIEVQVELHEVDQVLEAVQISQGVIRERKNLRVGVRRCWSTALATYSSCMKSSQNPDECFVNNAHMGQITIYVDHLDPNLPL